MLEKIFVNDRFFKILTIICAVCAACYLFYFLIPFEELVNVDFSWFFTDLMIGICPVLLYVSYNKHNKNFMKGMIGFLLAILLADDVHSLAYYISIEDSYYIMGICFLVLDLILAINHFILNSSRRSNRLHIKISQITLFLLVIAAIVGYLIYLFMPALDMIGASARDYFVNIAEGLNYVCVYALIVCIESRLDAYRIDRENAGWTEETGYPEGYVHEYEKRK